MEQKKTGERLVIGRLCRECGAECEGSTCPRCGGRTRVETESTGRLPDSPRRNRSLFKTERR